MLKIVKQIGIMILWIILFIGTSLFLLADWLWSLIAPKRSAKPYFKQRSIYNG